MTTARRAKRSNRKSGLVPKIPESVQGFMARRIIDLASFLLVVLGVFCLLALISYESADPSLNTGSAPEEIANWMGLYGALYADIILQTAGAAGLVTGLVFLSWGIRLYRRQTLRPFVLRTIALLATIITLAIALSLIPAQGWLSHPYLGGAGGTLMLNAVTAALQDVPYASSPLLTGLISGLVGTAALLYALAVRKSEMAAVLGFIWRSLILLAYSSYSLALGFWNWLAHYNDPAYLEKQKSRQAKTQTMWESLFGFLHQSPPRRTPPQVSTPKPPATKAPSAAPASKAQPDIPVVNSEAEKARTKNYQQRFALDEEGEWAFPSIDLIQNVPQQYSHPPNENALRKNAELLQNVLADFKIEGDVVSIHPGPVVTLYELEPAPGTKSARVINISDDIARSMSAVSVRCAVVPGRNAIGIELPNKTRQIVYMRELLEIESPESYTGKLPLILGKDIGGKPITADLSRMPHLLVAGTTGSGKSVAVNTMILSLLYRLPPEKCRFIMIDPKMLELSVYDDIPHLLSPVVTEPGKAVVALKWVVQEMEERYRAMSKLGVRNIEGYNQRLAQARKGGETIMQKVSTGFDSETGQEIFEDRPMDLTELPYIVVVVDEFADLMLVAGKDVENAIQRLAQMARAAGIHLIMATQRPSVDVITGVIKANFPTRISFAVTSKIDSRTILGESGAEQLLGMGDMLYMAPGGRIKRVHGPFVSDKDVENVVNFLKSQGKPNYMEDITEGGDFGESEIMNALFSDSGGSSDVDELYDQAVAIVAREGKASTSFVQRCLQIGYNRAARIIEEMERQGVISKASPTGKREILVRDHGDV